MTDPTAHHYDNSVALLDLATGAINAAEGEPSRLSSVAEALRLDARDAIAGAAVHAALAQTAALRDIALLLRTRETPEPIEAVLSSTEPVVPDYVRDAAERLRLLGRDAGEHDLGLLLGFVAGLDA